MTTSFQNISQKLLLPFQRITSSSKFIPQIDGLRFIAITAVFLFHLQGKLLKNLAFVDDPTTYLFHRLMLNGDFGVQLFFVISGFILAMPFASYYMGQTKRKIKLKSYFLRRITRLEPPYFIIIIACFILYVLVDDSIIFKEQFSHVLSALLYSHNFVYDELLKVNLVTWSLEIEVQFYILAPLLSRVFMLKALPRRSLLVFVILIMPILNTIFPFHLKSLYSYLQYFLIGFLLVDFYLNKPIIKIPRLFSFLLGGSAIFFIFFFDSHGNLVTTYLQFGLIFVFYSLVLFNEFWKSIFSNIWLTTIGGMCYTIYLIHFPAQGFLMKSVLNFNISPYYIPNLIFQFAIVSLVILVISGIFFRLVERPCMDKNWYKKRKKHAL